MAQNTKIRDFRCHNVYDIRENNPNNIILEFESKFLDLICSPDTRHEYHAVLVDSATNAIELCLMVNQIEGRKVKYNIPDQTYISVWNTVCRYARPNLIMEGEYAKWKNYYTFGNIIDSAAFIPNGILLDSLLAHFSGLDYLVLSFGNAKPFPMNKGGMIIFKKNYLKIKSLTYPKKVNAQLGKITKYSLLKRLSHDGRDSSVPVSKDTILRIDGKTMGHKMNLVPQQVEPYLRKLETCTNFEDLKALLQDVKVGYENYPKISTII